MSNVTIIFSILSVHNKRDVKRLFIIFSYVFGGLMCPWLRPIIDSGS